ncbi:alanine racemase [Altererythrobacter arenosus]|uniref:alanine racemase n=1 Tax=Altererythrobacter arenosus TaxID=3032592 RepID=A0ABY8FQD1_9SPHN|nr:alanine racemase [Altererythrobacter sp. CAU 1644]WFL77057.1 alanine racemase [Altererythrobacter sp. CAU 1644]
MPDKPSPTLRLAIDKDALAHNWRALDRMSGAANAGAAVKADCYGLGVDSCVPVLRDAGAKQFFVAHWSEVEAVARHVPAASISVLHGTVKPDDATFARATGVIPIINSLHQAQVWLEAGGGPCHLMVDTGINRLGLSMHEVGDPLIGHLEIDVLMSHLACADEDSAMNGEQLAAFRAIIPTVRHKSVSFANSAGIALGSDYHFDLTRPGLSLYGGIPRAELEGEIRQVAMPQAAIIQTRRLAAGDRVGYNATFTASSAMPVGVVSLGYADGFLRSWAGGHLLHGNAALPILGKVSMDMIVVDLSQAPDLREGDWVDVPYFLPDAAQQTSLGQYELLTILGSRLKAR